VELNGFASKICRPGALGRIAAAGGNLPERGHRIAVATIWVVSSFEPMGATDAAVLARRAAASANEPSMLSIPGLIGSGCVLSQSARAAALGLMLAFSHQAASSP